MILLPLLACVRDAPPPWLGACATYPDGVYEYGQVGIGTCLSGPTALQTLEGDVVAVVNSNAWLDFTGGSLLTLDLGQLPLDGDKVLLSDLTAASTPLPSFSGSLAFAEAHDLLLVANRLSEDARTRQAADAVYFVNVANPSVPTPANVGDDGTDSTSLGEEGYDPNGIWYDASTDRAFVVERTSHDVSLLDLSETPIAVLDVHPDASVEGDDFVDVDGSGSTAEFVELSDIDAAYPEPHDWTLAWSGASERAWIPRPDGIYRLDGDGEGAWTRSALDVEIALEDADGEVAEIDDPSFLVESTGNSRMFFEDEGAIRAADAGAVLTAWSFEEDALLSPGAESSYGGPHAVQDETGWYLFYDAGLGDGQSIALATATDGVTFDRVGAIIEEEGVSLEDPYVLYDGQADRWRMWYTRRADDGTTSIRQAHSDDLYTWTVEEDWSLDGVETPAVAQWSGRTHLYAQHATDLGWRVEEYVGVDGFDFDEPVVSFVAEESLGEETAPGLALHVQSSDSFTATDESGDVLSVAITPGVRLEEGDYGFRVRVATGFSAGVDDAGDAGAGGVQIDSRVGDEVWLTYTDEDGQKSIGHGTVDEDDVTLDPTPVLEAGAGGTFDADAVSSPVVAEVGGQLVMYYAGESSNGVTTIGRATSADGVTWTAGTKAVLKAGATWESVALEPGSVEVADDGSVRLWYSGYDGETWRIGLAESQDGVSFSRIDGAQYPWSFDAGTPGDWDDSGVRHPMVLTDDDGTQRLWFAGSDGSGWQIGYAERTSDGQEFTSAVDADGVARSVIGTRAGSFGAGGVWRPVLVASGDGWEAWYTGVDRDERRVGRAVFREADRAWRALRQPTHADSWGFTSIPETETDNIDLDLTLDGVALTPRGCGATAYDAGRGFLFVGCTLTPVVFVLDVRDDSTDTFADLNVNGVEALLVVETSTGSESGVRDMIYDVDGDRLWAVMDAPEAVYTLDVSAIADDDAVDVVRDVITGMLALPRGVERDEGVQTQASVGPGNILFSADGTILFITNFNDNSISAYDLTIGPMGTLVRQTDAIGENPFAMALTGDGAHLVVANFSGEVETAGTNPTLAILDADPTSDTFLDVLQWVGNR
jgi:predicted GH43/DUF377 family glycosyl hydrolase